MRRARLVDDLARALRPAVIGISAIGAALPVADSFVEQPSLVRGRASELLAMALPLWFSLDQTERLDKHTLIVGWPAYIRQDCPPSVSKDPHFRSVSTRLGVDIRLCEYDWRGLENIEARRKLQIKSGRTSKDYAPGRTVIAMQRLHRIRTPLDIRALFKTMLKPEEEVNEGEMNDIYKTARDFMKLARK
jgi:hypothetical protein